MRKISLNTIKISKEKPTNETNPLKYLHLLMGYKKQVTI